MDDKGQNPQAQHSYPDGPKDEGSDDEKETQGDLQEPCQDYEYAGHFMEVFPAHTISRLGPAFAFSTRSPSGGGGKAEEREGREEKGGETNEVSK